MTLWTLGNGGCSLSSLMQDHMLHAMCWIGLIQTELYYYLIVHPGKLCDSFDQLAKELVTHLAALLARTTGIRRQ